MDRNDMEVAAANVTYLRGLLAVPCGILFIVIGLGNLRWGPFISTAVFVATVAALALTALATSHWYNDRYGRATPSRRHHLRYGVPSALLIGSAMIGGPIVDSTFDLPVSAFAVLSGLAMLSWFGICVGLRPYHLVIWGALAVTGLLPVWGSLADKVSVAFLPIGLATIAADLLDHRTLVQTFGPAGDPDMAADSARA